MSGAVPAQMRPYRDDDAPRAVALIAAICEHERGTPPPAVGTWRAFVGNTSNRDGAEFLCIDQPGAAGADRALAALLVSGFNRDGDAPGGVQIGRILVHPAHRRRGLGRLLLAELERHAAAHGVGAIQGIAPARVAGGRAFAERHGFRMVVHDLRMARLAAAPIPDAEPPATATLRPHRSPDEDQAWAELVNVCFARDTEPTRLTVAEVAELAAIPGCVMRAADAGGELVGFCWTEPRGQELGIVQGIGVAEGHRRAGLARALLADALRGLVARGHTRIELTTEHDNAPAITLYRSFGFEIYDEFITWRRDTR